MALEENWNNRIGGEFERSYMRSLREFLVAEKQRTTIYPRPSEWFKAFELTPFESVKAVILGQDPYHGVNQAHGLAFSVRYGVAIPPSLINIYQELKDDLGIDPPNHGNLTAWAQNGVLLLNATLTVEANRAGSHQSKGWESFTDAAIDALNRDRQNLVFMLWGSYAIRKQALIDRQKHLILTAPHPSPLSAYRGFFSCKHFSQANRYLAEHGVAPIDWRL
ncbi:MAG: uracil-DNA glycosylase [Helicobacteraceae bacterium]|jgi:uracil-DNA glycosylase|nr:uracil-DNA glycosylase [Helicobacteraceae bacterium]